MSKKITILLTVIIFLTGCAGIRPDLGINNGRLTKCPTTPNCVSSMANDEKYYIDPIITMGSQLEAKQLTLNVLDEFKNATVIIIEDDYIRAEFTSSFFQFVDDIEFYFPETKSKNTIIHVRSASRVGYSDLGVNRKRIEQIRGMFKEVKIKSE